ncbi:hypothetical protein QMT40_002429 [Parvibaculaceae bacterium PLY_AMNH_Bact1]|nr:hypothetical protein QMT40_002429 [Parvibaculaceae bacterium PLY_AMNH_Bact1]
MSRSRGRFRGLGLVDGCILLVLGTCSAFAAIDGIDLSPDVGGSSDIEKGTALPPPPDFLTPATPRPRGSQFDAAPIPPEKPVRPFTEVGYGPFAIGKPVDLTDPEIAASISDSDQINPECHYVRIAQPGGELYLMLVAGDLARIDVSSMGPEGVTTGPSLPNGVGLGSPVGDITAAWGDKVATEPNKYGVGTDYIVTLTDTKGIVFETDEGKVTAYRVGRPPEVHWVEGCS